MTGERRPPTNPRTEGHRADASELAVRRVLEEEWRELRSLRLDALRIDPLAFGSTLERESEYTEIRWQESCRRGATSEEEATFVVPGPDDHLVGMLGIFSDGGEFPLHGMWVRPEFRGRGIGAALLREVVEWRERKDPTGPIVLDVNPRQTAAVTLYHRFRFEFIEPERPLGHHAPEVRRKMRRLAPALT